MVNKKLEKEVISAGSLSDWFDLLSEANFQLDSEKYFASSFRHDAVNKWVWNFVIIFIDVANKNFLFVWKIRRDQKPTKEINELLRQQNLFIETTAFKTLKD